jgi:ribosome-associated protein
MTEAAAAMAEVLVVVEAARAKKAHDIKVLDLREVASFCDYFVIMEGQSVRQSQAISDAIVRDLKAAGTKVGHVEGYVQGDWILLDCSDFVVHVFSAEKRGVYDLERLWADAVIVEVDEPTVVEVEEPTVEA